MPISSTQPDSGKPPAWRGVGNPSVFHSEAWVPRPLDEVFAFFSDAGNLQVITPAWLSFEILTPRPIAMRVGAIIDYRLRIHGFPVKWKTEITAWEPPHRFVDEQRRGPYRLWVHEHRFAERDGGTQMLDRVHYAVPGGKWIERLFVKRDVERIFAYREARLRELFGAGAGAAARS
jgi:hypothetical protein